MISLLIAAVLLPILALVIAIKAPTDNTMRLAYLPAGLFVITILAILGQLVDWQYNHQAINLWRPY